MLWKLSDLCYTVVMITKRVAKTILEQDLIHKGEHIVLGLSGGPDSVCLFYLLRQLAKEMDLTLHVVHVNHKFRPGAAEEDQRYVEELCQEFRIPCHSFACDCAADARQQGISAEEAGRNARYAAFRKVAEKVRRDFRAEVKIAVAHNADDQVETVLLRLLRGTGTDGLAGMDYRRKDEDGTEIIRPLMDVERSEIEAFCKEKGLCPRIDQTNLEPVYMRNRVRIALIPYIREHFNENISESLLRLSKIAREDKTYIWEEAEKAYGEALLEKEETESCRIVKLTIDALAEKHPAVRHRMILRAFEEIGLTKDISAAHLAAADKLVLEGRTSAEAEFPKGYRLLISYGTAIFRRDTMVRERGEPLSRFRLDAAVLSRDEWAARHQTDGGLIKNEKQTAWAAFDCDKLPELSEPELRVRRPGDFIRPSGMAGSKKLQDFFVDRKVPKENRDAVPLVALDNEILWIVGDDVSGLRTGLSQGRISGNYAVSKETANILLLELKKEL